MPPAAQVASGKGVVGGAESQGSGVKGAVAMDGRESNIVPGLPETRAG